MISNRSTFKFSISIFFYCLVGIFSANKCNAQLNSTPKIDSLKRDFKISKTQKSKVNVCFALVETFMDIDQYDSAQIWLNKIVEIVPVQQASINNYFVSSRQAEIYYYNRLLGIGLQESKQSLKIATALNDSLLLADAYNFVGLFYMNLDSPSKSLPYFKEGIRFTKQPPYPSLYVDLSKPHHLYGNLSEAYAALKNYDSAIYFSNISLSLAKAINWDRGIAVALNNLGNNYTELDRIDSAILYYKASISAAQKGGDFDVELANYGSLAGSTKISNRSASLAYLDNGFTLLKQYPFINILFTTKFLNQAIQIYKDYNLQEQLIKAQTIKSELLQAQLKNNNNQMAVILNASLLNETRLLNLQVEKANQQNNIDKTRLFYLSALILVGIIAFIFYRYALNQKLQKSNFRNKISKDLHDDVGSSLSSLNLYSTVASKLIDSDPIKAKEMLHKISVQLTQLMENIGDIVWSMKSTNEESINLSTKIKIFATDTLSAAEIDYKINIDDTDDVIVKSITGRRNILMIVKEAINNIVKYSEASFIVISIKKLNDTLLVVVEDNGKGFDVAAAETNGNGLSNMRKRAEELNGHLNIDSTLGTGTILSAIFPLSSLNNVGW